ncbi:hypothetical protein F5Y03DRAFT_261883 [Xylaria venustula]|nr:hypothetical protein F5Y03DRAFT_261883 [Xylaria venustula]
MAISLFKLVSALALGVAAVQGAATPKNDGISLRAVEASTPTRRSTPPTRVQAADPESTVGETVYLTSEIPLNDVMNEGDIYEITWEKNSRNDGFVLSVLSFIIDDDSVPSETTVLNSNEPFQALSYNWTVKAQEGRGTLDYVYRFAVQYDFNDGFPFQQEFTRTFQINTNVTTNSTKLIH